MSNRYDRLNDLEDDSPEATEASIFNDGTWVQAADGSWVRSTDRAAKKTGRKSKGKSAPEAEPPPPRPIEPEPPKPVAAEPKRRLLGKGAAEKEWRAEQNRQAEQTRQEEQRQLEEFERVVQIERERQAELHRQAEAARDARLERERVQAERERQMELDRKAQRERARAAELEREIEQERARVAELERTLNQERERRSTLDRPDVFSPFGNPEPVSPAGTFSPFGNPEPAGSDYWLESETVPAPPSAGFAERWAQAEPEYFRDDSSGPATTFMPAVPAAPAVAAPAPPAPRVVAPRRPAAPGTKGQRASRIAVATALVALALLVGAGINWLGPDSGNAQRPFTSSGAQGEVLDVRGFTVTVQSARAAASVQSGAGTHDTQGVWVILRVRLVATTEPAKVGYAALRDSAGYTYMASGRLTQPLLDGKRTFQPGIPMEGEVVFEVPQGSLNGLTALFAANPDALELDAMAEIELPALSVTDDATTTLATTEVKP